MENLNNRHSYFRVIFKPSSENTGEDNREERMEEALKDVLQKIDTSEQIYIIHNKDGSGEAILMFKSKRRKRISFFRNILNNYLSPVTPEDLTRTNVRTGKAATEKIKFILIKPWEKLSRKNFLKEFLTCRRNNNYFIEGVDSGDLEIFQDKKNWTDWVNSSPLVTNLLT